MLLSIYWRCTDLCRFLRPRALFFKDINTFDVKIQFNQPVIGKTVDYLDLSLTIDPSGRINFCTYEKSIASFNRYIHFNSLHPQSLKAGVVIGQTKRLINTCSSLFSSTYLINSVLFKRLREQGFPASTIKKSVFRALNNN